MHEEGEQTTRASFFLGEKELEGEVSSDEVIEEVKKSITDNIFQEIKFRLAP